MPEWTWDELLTHVTMKVIEGITQGRPIRSVMHEQVILIRQAKIKERT